MSVSQVPCVFPWPVGGCGGVQPARLPSQLPASLIPVSLLPSAVRVSHGAACGEQVPPGTEDREWVLWRHLPG